MNFSYVFIRRPIGTTLLVIGLLLVGATAYVFLPLASLPTVDFPTISVSASRPGAEPSGPSASKMKERPGENAPFTGFR